MKLSKRLLNHPLGQAFLARLASSYIRLVIATSRLDVDVTSINSAVAENGSVIVGFWHGRLMMMPLAWQGKADRFRMMISEHRDGLLISRAIGHFGYRTVPINRKSTGLKALRTMQRHLREKASVGITPDGPRGPNRQAKSGIVALARMSGAAIVPVTYSATRLRIFGSWDRFRFALPFSRIVVLSGEPLRVPRGAGAEEMEALRRRLEERLNALDAEADRRCGYSPEPPGASNGP